MQIYLVRVQPTQLLVNWSVVEQTVHGDFSENTVHTISWLLTALFSSFAVAQGTMFSEICFLFVPSFELKMKFDVDLPVERAQGLFETE